MKLPKIEWDTSKFHLRFRTKVDIVQELLEIPELFWNRLFGVFVTLWFVVDPVWWKILLMIPWVMITLDFRVEDEKK